jgi:hypothetical protein
MLPAGAKMSNYPRREPHFSLPIRQISPSTGPTWIIFNKWCFLVNKCNNNEVKRPNSWSDTPFWHISLQENQQKGYQEGEKPTVTKSAL